MEKSEEKKKFTRFLKIQVIIMGLLFTADQMFAFFEQNFFNTYLNHVLGLSEIYISIMVSLSAIMGLVFNLTWGIKSDNTRSKWGRRRPYLLFGGVTAGIAMILYGFSPNYWWALFFDVLIIGVASNAYFSSQRALIPDNVPPELRGRANGLITVFGNIGILASLVLFLISYEIFAIKNPRGPGTILTQEGHIFVLSIGGILFIICAIVGFLFIKEIPIEQMPPKKKFMVEFKEFFDLDEMRKQKHFFRMIGAYTIYKTGINTVMPFLFIFLFALGLTTLGLLSAILMAFVILMASAILMGKISDKHGRKKYVPVFLIICSIGYFLMPFAWPTETSEVNLLLFYIAIPLVVVGILGMPAPLDAWSQDLLPEDRRGKFLGIYNFLWVFSQIIGAFVGGIVAIMFGLSWIFLFGAIFIIISIPFFLRVKETLRTE